MDNYIVLGILIFCILLLTFARILKRINKFKGKKKTYGELGIDDIFGLKENIIMSKTTTEIVDEFYVVVEPVVIVEQFGKKVKHLEYTSRSLKDGKLFNFQDDTIVYFYFKSRNKFK